MKWSYIKIVIELRINNAQIEIQLCSMYKGRINIHSFFSTHFLDKIDEKALISMLYHDARFPPGTSIGSDRTSLN